MKRSSSWWRLAIVGVLIASPVYTFASDSNEEAAASAESAQASATGSDEAERAPAGTALTDTPVSPVQTSTTEKSDSFVDKLSLKYALELGGSPTLGQVDGAAGPGANITLYNYFSFGYKVSDAVSLSLTPYFTASARANNAGDRDTVEFGDMYFTAFHNSLYTNEQYGLNLAGYIRAYFPTSQASNNPTLIGSTNEQQNGKVRVRLFPSKTWLDGALKFTFDTSLYLPFRKGGLNAGNATSVRDYYAFFFPNLSYELNESWAPYVGFNAPITHYKDAARGGEGRWDRFSDGNSVEVGFTWTGVKDLLVNPFLAFGTGDAFRDATIGFIAEYKIL